MAKSELQIVLKEPKRTYLSCEEVKGQVHMETMATGDAMALTWSWNTSQVAKVKPFPSTIVTLCMLGLCAGVIASPAEAQDASPNDVVEGNIDSQPGDHPQVYPPPQQAHPPPAAYGYAQPVSPVQPQVQPLEHRRPNTIYIEGFGGGVWWSLNFERLVVEDLAIRGGFGYITLDGIDSVGSSVSVGFFSVPVSVSYLGLGSARHMLEVGVGVTVIGITGTVRSGLSTSSGAGATVFGQVFSGYRYHPSENVGFNFRAGVLALIGRGLSLSSSDPDAIGAIPWPYMSAGASF